MARINALFDSDEYQRAADGAKILAKHNFLQNYSSHFVLLLYYDTDTIRFDEHYLHSFSIVDNPMPDLQNTGTSVGYAATVHSRLSTTTMPVISKSTVI